VDASGPRALRDPVKLAARRASVGDAPHLSPLQDWIATMVARRGSGTVAPDFDPSEAGVDARVLVLLEAPGPMTNSGNARPGSGFISVDNDDQTAENCWTLRRSSGLVEGVLHWNIVPWYLGPASVKPNAQELAQGAMELRSMLPLLPNLSAVVLCGRYAQTGWTDHIAPFTGQNLRVLGTWHPSARSLNQLGHRADVERAFKSAATYA